MISKSSSDRTLPARPSLESLRKQSKTLARKVAAGDPDAVERVRARLPAWEPPLSQRDAQLVLAREYGFAGWKALREEVLKRTGAGLEWAASEAKRAIHDNDVERLKTLLAEQRGLLQWHDEQGHPLLQATTPYAMDVSDPAREAEFCRPECAAVLIDAGAVVTPSVWDALIRSGAARMLALLDEKKALPRTLAVLAALGDREGVRARLDDSSDDAPDVVSFAFMSACRFKHEAVAATLLDRAIALDPKLGAAIGRAGGRAAFVAEMIARCPSLHASTEPWLAFVMRGLLDAMRQDDLPAFTTWLAREPRLLDDAHVALQAELLAQAAEAGREAFIRELLAREPAVLRSSPPPSNALIWAFDYGHAHLVPLLTRVWPLPDDLPHAAGRGDLDRVKRWFDDDGRPMLGDPGRHHRNVRPGAPTVQQVLDVALAWAVRNKHFHVAEFLLARGADVNTDWATHEPASILHECAVHGDFDGARFLVDHGIDLTIRDHRWNATAAGWAWHAANDEAMCKMLTDAEEERNSR